MSSLAVAPNQPTRDLALLIDNQVQSLSLTEGRYKVEFLDGRVETMGRVYRPVIMTLAAMANDNLRGVRSNLGHLLNVVEASEPSAIIFRNIDSVRVLITVRSPTGERCMTLHRNPKAIAPPYDSEEFGRISRLKITDQAPGRALSPLPASVFRERARLLVDRVLAGDRDGLLALPPLMIVMGITDYCNHKCPFCFRERDPFYQRTDGNIFTENNLTNLFLNLAEGGVQSIRLCGEGEDTIHPQYLKFILMARVAGINLMQITNGTMLKRLAPIIVRCVDFLRVSINGWTEEAYQQKHGLASSDVFCRVIDGLQEVSREKKALTTNRPQTTCISTVLTEEDLFEYRPEDFCKLFNSSDANLAILKTDGECSRTKDGRLVRLKVHEDNSQSIDVSSCLSLSNGQDAFNNLLLRCRDICPQAFNYLEQVDVSLHSQKDWITELELGCVLRYIRAELERFELYNCTQLHDYYGDLRLQNITTAWRSQTRQRGIAQDIKRPTVICPGCGWGDLFRIMNFFINEEISASHIISINQSARHGRGNN